MPPSNRETKFPAKLSRNYADEPTAKWARAAEWLLFALLISYLGLHTLPASWKRLNTDFPNYYLTARIARERSNTSRIYEWIWLQRQKDHRGLDEPIVGLIPITPFSALAAWPMTTLPPLVAKHYWLIFNIALVAVIVVLLRSLTQLSLRRVLLVTAMSFPLNKNLLFGQYYILLLFVLTFACWCYIRQRRFLSGFLIGIGFGLKLFPLLYLGYFLRKKDWRAFAGGVISSLGVTIISVAAFGWQAHRVLSVQILPWALRGEAMDPYNTSSASLATLLHRLFIFEPIWNPTPSIHAAWMFAVLLPLLQTLLFAPALLLANPGGNNAKQLQLEWSAVLIASLAISTLPASYHFTLLILPVCLMWNVIQKHGGFAAVSILIFLYLAIGYPGLQKIGAIFGSAIFSVPRFYLVVLLCLFSYKLLVAQRANLQLDRDTRLWGCAFVLFMLLKIASGLHHQRGLYADYEWRMPSVGTMLQADNPVAQNDNVLFTSMLPDGYHSASQADDIIKFDSTYGDQLALAANSSERWAEKVNAESIIVSSRPGGEVIHQAESPVASTDGRWLAFLREEHGRDRLWLHVLDQPGSVDKILTPAELNVTEMSFLPNGSLIFTAEPNGGHPRLFLVDQAGSVSSLGPDEIRYPAVSPDGHWFAFSKLESGNWHLWLRDLHNGQTSKLTDADCNNVEPAWLSDSKTLLYASDCGRALWFTALCRRPIP
jgi:hypothetical protein